MDPLLRTIYAVQQLGSAIPKGENNNLAYELCHPLALNQHPIRLLRMQSKHWQIGLHRSGDVDKTSAYSEYVTPARVHGDRSVLA